MFYAKSFPKETIRFHTDRLLENYHQLKDSYGDKFIHMNSRHWQLLKWAVEYHDVGKAETVFQNKLRKHIDLPQLSCTRDYYIPHNLLSAVLIPYKKLGLDEEELKLLAHAVGYHHEREIVLDNELKKKIRETVKQGIMGNVDDIADHMQIPMIERPAFRSYDILQKRYYWGMTLEERERFLKYVMLKGLLHRLDHSASAGVTVEQCVNEHIGRYVNMFFHNTEKQKRQLQVFAEDNTANHIIAIAQTGMGKTEAGLLWIDKDKGFFTLPLRVSINAMYDRIKDPEGINFPSQDGAVGLLHSSSLDYLEQEDDGINWEDYNNRSRQFANKILIATIDQILKFPFFYRGFEKEFSALAGAKLVIDELQSYDPKVAALIIRSLEMIDAIGGKFMIMTATMPKLYLDHILNKVEIKRFPIKYKTFINEKIKRHRIQLLEYSITDYVKEIAIAGNKKKVLVICNTVKKAVEVYNALLEEDATVYLLHSLFIQKDRAELERAIKAFVNTKAKLNGIWVTTQLVEASLDIDFDMLYTEMSILDSLFQRLGRCYRQRMLDTSDPNVCVFTQEVSGVSYVYDKELFKMSINLLEPYSGKVLLESAKMNLIEKLYAPNSLQGTGFLETFNATFRFLKTIEPYDINKAEAQKYLRDIQQIKVIPRSVFDEINDELIQQYRNEKDVVKRRRLRREIDQHTVGINKYRVRDMISINELPKSLRDIAIVDLHYEFQNGYGEGLSLTKELSNFS